ncbi:MAG: DUF5684 domain-containing protein [Nibricoccus sp.]
MYLAIAFSLALIALLIVANWKVYTKAGQPGWGSLIPIYNIYLLLKMAGKPGWWLLLFLIPPVGFIITIIVLHSIAKCFGKDIVFTLLLLFIPIIAIPILGFGDAEYASPLE